MVPSEPVNEANGPESGLTARQLERERLRTACGEGAVHGVEGDVVHGVDERLVLARGRLVAAVALEREVVSEGRNIMINAMQI